MNKIPALALVALLGLGSVAAQAQTKMPPRKPVQPKAKVTSNGPSVKDGVTLKDGKVLMTQSSLTTTVTQETSLINGTKIQPDGTVTMKDGTTTTLKEGDYMSLSGRLTTAAYKAQQDSLLQAAKDNSKGKKGKKKGK
ncbi:hypothetical protein J0X19_20405 [Hymenobacter sp. BT186]|uniref:DUF6799 domain-containing protein n=1 Tax=Hymenobacter telluris TaxID=2816474 RepID=A0A939F027_9BACT|nr:DUF6799 domain-containing protein [Hymenobacter telluris]MBO0360334.1 hypothetical protein [Hymenobacter telluris]MBW3376361.1 hypothetical protein [Hymenobacter norwichensis]